MTPVCLVADCLKSYEKYREINVMMRLGPTLVGAKPMHIFCFKKDFKFIKELLSDIEYLFSAHKNIHYHLVYSRNNSIKVIIYNKKSMNRLLMDQRILKFLTSRGYSDQWRAEDYMTSLCSHLLENHLPEEYGVFFGYPLKDVIGFIGHPSLKHVKTTAWKIYGDPKISDIIHKEFKRAEERALMLSQSLPLESVVEHLDTSF
jgi:hypothetical protein